MKELKTIEPCQTALAIRQELDRQGRTRYWLMKQTDLDSPTVYGFLQGSLDCRISTVERMMDTLGMTYKKDEQTKENRRHSSPHQPECNNCEGI